MKRFLLFLLFTQTVYSQNLLNERIAPSTQDSIPIPSYYDRYQRIPPDKGLAIMLGYHYMNTHTGYIGLDYYSFKSHPFIWIGAGAYLGSFNHQFRIVPAAHLTLYNSFFGIGNGVHTYISPKHINPGVFINWLDTYWFHLGYSWSFDKKYNIKGITFGVNINLLGDFATL